MHLVLGQTNRTTLSYVGYSQGAGSLFALLSLRPEYATKIDSLVCWAPAVYNSRCQTRIRSLLSMNEYFNFYRSGPFVLTDWFNSWGSSFCSYRINAHICEQFLNQVFGPSENLNRTRLPVYTHFSPSPCSRWQLAHYTQIAESGRFARFDYHSNNNKVYGQSTPPSFPLRNIPTNIPTLLIYGNTDWFIDPRDVEKLTRELKGYQWKELEAYKVASKTWNHFDFLAGMNAGKLVNSQSREWLDRHY